MPTPPMFYEITIVLTEQEVRQVQRRQVTTELIDALRQAACDMTEADYPYERYVDGQYVETVEPKRNGV